MFPPEYFSPGTGSFRIESGLMSYHHVDGLSCVLDAMPHPASIAGLQLWLRADALGTIPDGGAVASWPDVSGRARHASPPSGAQAPTLRAVAVNGRPAVRFNGTTNVLDGASGTWRTLVAVARCSPTPIEHMSLWGASQVDQGVRRLGSGPSYSHNNANDFAPSASYRIDGLATNQVANGAWHLLSCRSDTARNFPYRVGGLGGSTTLRRWSGEIAELLVYDSALTVLDLQRVEQYLGIKYGLPPSR